MNLGMSILFRSIPLAMGLICLFLGISVLGLGKNLDTFIAGHVLLSLTAICYALFTTASVIIQQLIGSFSRFWMFFWPVTGYVGALIALIWGATLLGDSHAPEYFVAGHVVMGVVWASTLLTQASIAPHFVAGNVLLGLSLICASLISLVASVVRQVRNTFGETERWYWGWWVMLMGTILIVMGIYYLNSGDASVRTAPAIVLIGLGMICYSISSKVWLLALVWRRSCELANRIPLIPVFTCLFCIFTAAFLTNLSVGDAAYFIPSKVLVGLGAVCFTLFSIVSILEAGTSK